MSRTSSLFLKIIKFDSRNVQSYYRNVGVYICGVRLMCMRACVCVRVGKVTSVRRVCLMQHYRIVHIFEDLRAVLLALVLPLVLVVLVVLCCLLSFGCCRCKDLSVLPCLPRFAASYNDILCGPAMFTVPPASFKYAICLSEDSYGIG